MEETANQNVANYRDQLVGRMKTRFPDRNYTGTDGTAGTDDLEKSIMEALDDYDSQIGGYKEREDRLTGLFNTDQRAASFLSTWVKTKSPAMAFRKIYGQDAFNAIQSEEGAKILADIEAEEAKNKADDEAFEQQKQQNLQQSFEALDKWGSEKGLDDDAKVDLFMRFYDILSDALEGKYSTDLFEMAWKADHYTNDVENARHEGEVAGRNANIKATQRRHQENNSMPPALSGQGVRSDETPKRSADNPWMLD